jgi:hypothetical protein
MLEYTKMILQKVSFDRLLFVKELQKGLNWLTPDEIKVLYNWLVSNFTEPYNDDIQVIFNELRVSK